MGKRSKRQRELSLGETKLASIIIPSRKRVKYLNKSIDSILKKTSDLSKIQLILRFDNDDEESINNIANLPFSKVDITIIVGNRMRGYHDLNKYVNECCGGAKGDFMMLFNDDSYIVTNDWDLELEKHLNTTVVLNPDTHDDAQCYNTFPIISRDIYDLTGHFSLNAHNDTWVSYIAKRLNIEKHIDIEIYHDRPDNPNYIGSKEQRMLEDKTWAERTSTFPHSMAEFNSREFVALREEYTQIIKNNLLNGDLK